MQNYKKITLASGKEIHIYDGIVSMHLRSNIWIYINNSSFRLGWLDGTSETAIKHKFLHSSFTPQETEDCGLLPHLKTTPVYEHIKDLELKKSIVNLSVPSDTHFAHVHNEKKVVLYYPNMEWEQHWHGETQFYSEDLSEIELSVRYTPGRVVVFDATIPHAMRPQSTSADHYRFTYAMVFD